MVTFDGFDWSWVWAPRGRRCDALLQTELFHLINCVDIDERTGLVIPKYCFQHRVVNDASGLGMPGTKQFQFLWHVHSVDVTDAAPVLDGQQPATLFRLCLQLIGPDDVFTAPAAPPEVLDFFEGAAQSGDYR